MDLITSDIADYMAHEDLRHLSLKYLDISNPKQANVALTKDRIYMSDSYRNKTQRPQLPF